MRIRPARLLFAFAIGIGCTVVFTFPSWSSGMVRGSEQSLESDGSVLPRLVIESKQHTLTIHFPGKAPVVMKAQGAYKLNAGAHTVVGKELNPLWKAPPTYFLRRGLQVPERDSPAGLLRGALGHQALALNGELSLHSGPVWNDDVGGVRLSSVDMALLFETVPVGATVEVL